MFLRKCITPYKRHAINEDDSWTIQIGVYHASNLFILKVQKTEEVQHQSIEYMKIDQYKMNLNC